VSASARPLGRLAFSSTLVIALTLVLDGVTCAAEPAATAAAAVLGGDPRSEGTGPGLVGSPLIVLAAVIILGLMTVLLTALVVRFGRRG
jgi:hypothetical protein